METDSVEVLPVLSAEQLETLRGLWREYGATIVEQSGNDEVLRAQGFDAELASLPGDYASPGGALLLALVNGQPAGSVALRPAGSGIMELKRLYVRPEYRGQSLGRRLLIEAMDAAAKAGSRSLRLDTLPFMRSAVRLYRGMGFEEIPPWQDKPTPGARFFELALEPAEPEARLDEFRSGDEKEFERLNREWLEEFFRVEAKDKEYFADPVGTIITPGGRIVFIREGERTVGTCAVIRHADGRYELAKMAVQYDCRGKGYGQWLVSAAIDFVKAQGAPSLFLLSDEKLTDALRLYERMGFVRKQFPGGTGYSRGNIYMDREL